MFWFSQRFPQNLQKEVHVIHTSAIWKIFNFKKILIHLLIFYEAVQHLLVQKTQNCPKFKKMHLISYIFDASRLKNFENQTQCK